MLFRVIWATRRHDEKSGLVLYLHGSYQNAFAVLLISALLYVGALVKEKRSSYVPQPIHAAEGGSVWGRIAATPDHITIRSTR
jgi:hypothetical protein